mgnify:CR=1 FL=1
MPGDASWGTNLPGYNYLVDKATLEAQLSINFCVHVLLVLTEERIFRAGLNGPSPPRLGTLCRHPLQPVDPSSDLAAQGQER